MKTRVIVAVIVWLIVLVATWWHVTSRLDRYMRENPNSWSPEIVSRYHQARVLNSVINPIGAGGIVFLYMWMIADLRLTRKTRDRKTNTQNQRHERTGAPPAAHP